LRAFSTFSEKRGVKTALKKRKNAKNERLLRKTIFEEKTRDSLETVATVKSAFRTFGFNNNEKTRTFSIATFRSNPETRRIATILTARSEIRKNA